MNLAKASQSRCHMCLRMIQIMFDATLISVKMSVVLDLLLVSISIVMSPAYTAERWTQISIEVEIFDDDRMLLQFVFEF